MTNGRWLRHLVTGPLALLAGLALFGAGAMEAQTRTLAGRVTDLSSGRGVGEGTVSVRGTGLRDALRPDGVFVLRVPAGPVTLVVRAPGYPELVAEVPAEQEVALLVIRPDPVRLAGFAARTRADRRGTAVSGRETSKVPAASFVDALGSKVPGAVVARNSGAPAGLRHIQVRGISTLLGATAPLVVVDGVVIRSTGGADGSSVITGGLPQNADRLVDLSPYDIASVELLKGAAATARYGSRGANGVLLITTRRR